MQPALEKPLLQGPQFRLAPPDATSAGRNWRGITVHWHDWQAGGEVQSPELDHDVIAMRTSGTVRLTQIRDGKTHVATVSAGNVSLHPRGIASRWMWDRPGAILVLRVPQPLLVEAVTAVSADSPRQVEMQSIFSLRDQFIEQLGLQLLRELNTPEHPSQAYIAQSLSDAIACHMVYRLNSRAVRPQPLRPHLAVHHLQRVQDYMAANLHERLDLQTLADVVNISRFHFARAFRESAGSSVMVYLERVRMQRAQELIRIGDLPLSLIASLVGYEDPSYFSRRFRLFSGQTPSSYARAVGAKRA